MNNEKKNITHSKRIEKCKKVINIICYICTFLFALLMALTGMQSCKKTTATHADDTPVAQVHNLALTTWEFNEDIDFGRYWDTGLLLDFELQSGTRCIGFQFEEYLDDNVLLYTMASDAPITAYSYNTGWDQDYFRTIYFYEDYNANNYDDGQFIEWLSQNAKLVTPMTNFTFLKDYNYNAPLGQNLGPSGLPFMNSDAWVNVAGQNATETSATLLVLPFYVNGKMYNAIISHYAVARNTNPLYTENDSGEVKQAINGMYVFDYMSYAYMQGSNTIVYSDIVNIRDTNENSYNDTAVITYLSSTTWINDSYRKLIFEGYVISGNLAVRLNAFNNNNYTYYTINNDGDIFDALGLLGGVFTSIAPFLGIYILPGLTIGVIIFIPLIISVVFFIIDKIKK